MSIEIAKRTPILPLVEISAATTNFCGMVRVFPATDAAPDLLRPTLRDLAGDEVMAADVRLLQNDSFRSDFSLRWRML